MPRSAASDLGLHCLSICQKWDARHKRVNAILRLEQLVIDIFPSLKFYLILSSCKMLPYCRECTNLPTSGE